MSVYGSCVHAYKCLCLCACAQKCVGYVGLCKCAVCVNTCICNVCVYILYVHVSHAQYVYMMVYVCMHVYSIACECMIIYTYMHTFLCAWLCMYLPSCHMFTCLYASPSVLYVFCDVIYVQVLVLCYTLRVYIM